MRAIKGKAVDSGRLDGLFQMVEMGGLEPPTPYMRSKLYQTLLQRKIMNLHAPAFPWMHQCPRRGCRWVVSVGVPETVKAQDVSLTYTSQHGCESVTRIAACPVCATKPSRLRA